MIVFGAALAVALVVVLRTGALEKAIGVALDRGDLTQLRAVLGGMSPDQQPTAYNQAIARLWEKFERNLACELISDLAESHHETNIAQYWLNQVLVTEPTLARSRFDERFLAEFFRPEVAARCGKFG